MTVISSTTVTTLLIGVYQDILGLPEADADSDFFEWGGDSLSAFQITARLEEALGVEVPVALVFAYPTPGELAEVVETDLLPGRAS